MSKGTDAVVDGINAMKKHIDLQDDEVSMLVDILIKVLSLMQEARTTGEVLTVMLDCYTESREEHERKH